MEASHSPSVHFTHSSYTIQGHACQVGVCSASLAVYCKYKKSANYDGFFFFGLPNWLAFVLFVIAQSGFTSHFDLLGTRILLLCVSGDK